MAEYFCPRCRKELIKYGERYRCTKTDCVNSLFYTEDVLEKLNPEALIYLGDYPTYGSLYLAVDKDTLSFGFYSYKNDRWYYSYTFKDIAIKISLGEEVIYKVVGTNPRKREAAILDEDGNIVEKYFLVHDKAYNVAITLNDVEFTGCFIIQRNVNLIRDLVTVFEVLRKSAIEKDSDRKLTHDEALQKIEDLKKLKNDGIISDNEFQDLKNKYVKYL